MLSSGNKIPIRERVDIVFVVVRKCEKQKLGLTERNFSAEQRQP